MRCPFCEGEISFAFRRAERSWGRCSTCGAFLRTDRRSIEDDVYDDNDLVRRIETTMGAGPAFANFDEMAPLLREGNILEIGAGSGHLIAAAKARGREVSGTELSPHHRAYVKQHWGIELTESLPSGPFNNVISVNVFEHIADPFQHLAEIRSILSPGGRFIISTANADCLIAKLCGAWWAMFKPEDHFSIPSARSIRMVAQRANVHVSQIWCSEYALETPIGIAIALRDRVQGGTTVPVSDSSAGQASITGRAQRLRELHAFNFVGEILARLMMANSIKAIFEKR